MEQHPIPRQITSFEFKLIGFMTLHQFLYLVVFFPSAFVVFKIIPIPIINVMMALITAGFGIAFAFLPIQDRPLDVWIKNLWKRLNAPTQYTYHKNNPSITVLHDLYYVSDPHKVSAHIETREKLASYLTRTQPKPEPNIKKQQIQSLLNKPPVPKTQPKTQAPAAQNTKTKTATPLPQALQQTVEAPNKPFLLGTVKNNKKIPLPGVLVYIKDKSNKPIRLLKTNPHGVFATFHTIPQGEYTIEPKDPKEGYFFDTMKITITSSPANPLEIHSKEML